MNSPPLPKCFIVEKGTARASIVGRKDSWDRCLPALMELRTGIAKMTNVRMPLDASEVLTEQLEPNLSLPTAIEFHLANPALSLGKDGFRISIEPQSLIFEAQTSQGFLNAVYTFLEQFCSFAWLWPGEEGEVYVKSDTLTLSVGVIEEIPYYRWRFIWDGDPKDQDPSSWTAMEFHMQPDQVTTRLFHQWCRRNRLGGLKARIGHAWGSLVDPAVYGQSHPEYFAEINGSRQTGIATWNGKHGGQLCTTNPKLIDLFVSKVRTFFDHNPEYDIFSISPNDGEGYCECDQCIELDLTFGNPLTSPKKQPDSQDKTFTDDADRTAGKSRITGPITDRIFTFANAVADQIAKSHPDKLLLLLVYGPYRQPPRKVKLRSNVIAQFCLQSHQHWDTKAHLDDRQKFETLAACVSKPALYDYFDQGAWPGITRSFPDLIAQTLTIFGHIGARYFFTQAGTGFAVNGFNLWFLTRALWDPNLDVDKALDRYCQLGFGPAAEIMIDYFNLWRQRWKDCQGLSKLGDQVPGFTGETPDPMTPFEQIHCVYPKTFLDTCSLTLESAREKVPILSIYRTRINFIARGLEATQLAVKAAEVSCQLIDQGWPLRRDKVTPEAIRSLGDSEVVRAKAIDALARWNRWEAYVESVRNEFIMSHFWTRYCFDSRKQLHPHYALQKIVELLDHQLEIRNKRNEG